MTAPLPKKGTTGKLKQGKGKKTKKQQGMGLGAQVVGGLTLLAVVGGVAALGVYLAESSRPKDAGSQRAPGDAVAVRPTSPAGGHDPRSSDDRAR